MRSKEADDLLRRAVAHAEQRAASETYDVESALERFEREIRSEQAAEESQVHLVGGTLNLGPEKEKAPAGLEPRPKPVRLPLLWRPRFAMLVGCIVGVVSVLVTVGLQLIQPGHGPTASLGPPRRAGSSTYLGSGAYATAETPDPSATEQTPGSDAQWQLQAFASGLDSVVRTVRREVPLDAANSCRTNIYDPSAMAGLYGEAQELSALAVSAVPDGEKLQSAAVKLLSDRITFEQEKQMFADEAASYCAKQISPTSLPSYQRTLAAYRTVQSDAAAFVTLWNPLAGQYGLETYQAEELD